MPDEDARSTHEDPMADAIRRASTDPHVLPALPEGWTVSWSEVAQKQMLEAIARYQRGEHGAGEPEPGGSGG